MILHLKLITLWSLPLMAISLIIQASIYKFRIRRISAKGLKTTLYHELALAGFVVYLSFVLTVTLSLDRIWVPLSHGWPLPKITWFSGTVNLIPFKNTLAMRDITMLAENIILFFPLGFFVSLLWYHEKWLRTVRVHLVFSLVIECIQIIIGRCFDVDDLLMNTIGAQLGYALWRIINMRVPSFSNALHIHGKRSLQNEQN